MHMTPSQRKRIEWIKAHNSELEVNVENFPTVWIHNDNDQDAAYGISLVINIGKRGAVQVIGGRNEWAVNI